MEAAFYEAWEDAGLADEAAPRAKGSRPSSQNKRKVRHESADATLACLPAARWAYVLLQPE